MQKQIDILKKARVLMLKAIDHLSIDQLNTVPEGFNNNIAWNIAHLVVTQQLLCYKLSGLKCLVSDEMIANFQKGTSPSYKVSAEEFEGIKKLFLDLPTRLESDYESGIFKNFHEYATSVNITLASITDAIEFNSFHEGIHLGIILQLRKLV